MGKLSIGKYAGLCVLGGLIAYTACMAYGLLLTGQAVELHLALFQLLPGFTGMNFISWCIGAITVALWSGVGGAYIAWMHNVSIRN